MANRPRVLHVYKDIYPPVRGGVEMHMHDVCLGLRDAFDFAILVAHNHASTQRTDLDGIPVVKAATWGRLTKAPACPTFPYWLAKMARRADIVHYHLPNPTATVSHLLARPRPPAVATYHSDIVRQQWALGVYGPVLRAFLRRMSAILPTSERYMRSSPFLSPIADRCRPVPLGIDTAAFAPTPESDRAAQQLRARYAGAPLIGFVGALRAYKGLEYLIEAMKSVAPGARCLIAGEGEMRPALEAMSRESGVAGRIDFLGAISEDEKVGLLRAIDIFCLPSHLRSEAFGLSAIEAMASGTPVVACDLDTGVPTVTLHERTGLIVAPASPAALSEAIGALIAAPERARRLGEAGRQRAIAHFDQSLMFERIADVYRELLG